MPNSERLAEVYEADVPQMVVIWPLVWKHYPRGEWFVSNDLSSPVSTGDGE